MTSHRLFLAFAVAVSLSAGVGCGLLPTELRPGYCERDRDCALGLICSAERDPATFGRCVTPGTDGGRDGDADGGDAADGAGGCRDTRDCPDDKPACGLGGVCIPCGAGDAGVCAARDPAKPICGGAGACVECAATADCTATAAKPICDVAAGACVRCKADTECAAKDAAGPGICLADLDGRCASEGEVIYVELNSTCVRQPTAGGTASRSYCTISDGVTAISPTRRVIVARGNAGGPADLTVGNAAPPVTVIGQQNASLSSGQDLPVLHVGAGELHLRGDLTVGPGANVGIAVDGTAILRADGITVIGNQKGGLRVTGGAGYAVVNSILTGNGGTAIQTGLFIGGAALDTPTSGRPARFAFNTVVDNLDRGVICQATSQTLEAALLFSNVVSGAAAVDSVGCTLVQSRTTANGDPKLTTTDPKYRLTEASPCVDAVSSAGLPAPLPDHDVDGHQRPQGAALDCGASELRR